MLACADWIRQSGGDVHPDLDLTSVTSTDPSSPDRGIRATAHIKEDQQLLKVPVRLCLHIGENLRGGSAAATAVQAGLSPFLATTALLLHELGQGAGSSFVSHLKTLPTAHNCTFAWQASEQDWLAGTAAESKGASAQELHADKLLPLMQSHPQLWPEDVHGFAAFAHAAGMVQSRTFHMQSENWLTGSVSKEEALYMLPGIDMVNHATDPQRRNTSLSLQDSRGREVPAASAPADACFIMCATRSIAHGEEVLHTYGDLSDAELLQTYGFVENLGQSPSAQLRNPHNKVDVPINLVQTCCSQVARSAHMKCKRPGAADRLAVLQAWEVLEDVGFQITWDDPMPEQLIIAMQVLLLPSDDWSTTIPQQNHQPSTAGQALASDIPEEFGLDAMMQNDRWGLVTLALLSLAKQLLQPKSKESGASASKKERKGLRWRQAQHVRQGELALVQRYQKAVQVLMLQQEAAGDDIDDSSDDASDSQQEATSNAYSDVSADEAAADNDDALIGCSSGNASREQPLAGISAFGKQIGNQGGKRNLKPPEAPRRKRRQ